MSAVSEEMIDSQRAETIIQVLGWRENIEELDRCVTRFRFTVRSLQRADDDLLTQSAASRVIKRDNEVQVIYGPDVTVIKNEIEKAIAS